jgi:uncharacterized protein YndB with AHSA1/START domain
MTPAAESSRDRVVVVRRRFQTSRAFLFQAWTDPDRFVRWFGPKGWTLERCEVDARPGGRWRAWFRKGGGASVYVGGVYSEVELNRRLVFTWDTSPDGGGDPQALSVVNVEFREDSAGAEICITHRKLATAQAVDMDAGWNNTFDSLQEYVAAQAAV